MLDKNGQLKCFLKKEAQKGQANAELRKTLAKKLSITQDLVEITLGAISKRKTIKFYRYYVRAVTDALGIEQQIKLHF